jgi:glycosyltransferase involved in cell wall biosynthesis
MNSPDRPINRILHITGSINPAMGGPVEAIIRQAEIHRSFGTSVEIACTDSPDAPWISSFPLKSYPLGIRSPFYQKIKPYIPWLRYGYTPHLTAWLRAHLAEYDVVIVNGIWNYASLGAWRALRNSGAAYFVFTHGMLDPWFKKASPIKHWAKQLLWLLADGRLLAGARAVLFTSEEERRLADGVFFGPTYRGVTIGYGTADIGGDPVAQIAAFRNKAGLAADRRFLLFLSRIHPKKGCDLLIGAFAGIARQYPDLSLVMAGPDQVGWRRELDDMAAQAGIRDRVIWPGLLSGDAKWGALRAAEAMVLPSHQENFGMVVAETLACGTPVLISDKVNIWREVAAGECGLVAPDDAAGTRDLLERFLALDPAARRHMSEKARLTFQEHFDVGKMVVRLRGCFRSADQ